MTTKMRTTKKHIHIDIETFSAVDLKECGVYRYADDPTFEILLLAYAVGDKPIKVIDLARGEQLPEGLIKAIQDPSIIKLAHNATFERVCLSKHLKTKLDASQWECTMIRAATMGMPHSLAEVAKALELDEQKMVEGKKLISLFCRPQTDKEGNTYKVGPEDEPEKWETFKEYCGQDVEVERAIEKKLESKPQTTEEEKKIYEIDQKINDKGALVEMRMVHNILAYYDDYNTRLTEEAQRISGIENPKSAVQAKKWLVSKGIEVVSLDKDAVKDLLSDKELPSEIKKFLKIKQELGKTSIMKYDAMKRAVCSDGRVHGMLQFYGAERTGRWAGRIVQLQNLPKNKISDLDLAREIVLENDFELLEMLYKAPLNICSQLIRTAFIAPDGYTFAVADYSAIEARVIAWLANEEWRQKVFEGGGKIYEASASQMFNVPIEKITKDSPLRAKGKVAELACIAEGTLILTNKGPVSIEKITKAHMLWDGSDFVNHEGLIYKGIREVITYEGLTATKDHLVWVKGEDRPIQFSEAAKSGKHLLQSSPTGRHLRAYKNNKHRKKIYSGMVKRYGTGGMPKLQEGQLASSFKLNKREIERMPNMQPAKTSTKMVRPKIYCSKATMYKSKRQKLQKLWRSGYRVQVQQCIRGLPVYGRRLWTSGPKNGDRSNRCKWPLRTWKPKVGNAQNKLSEPKKVYDILNCGPNNRYTANGYLVHNCGYGGGVEALKAMGAEEMGLTEDELRDIITAWRKASPNIVNFWKDVENAAKRAISNPGKHVPLRNLSFQMKEESLFVKLPSGRELAYYKAQLRRNPTRQGIEITYYGREKDTGKWQRISTYGGKMVENITQAVARDCLAWALIKMDEAKICPVFHVHDEVVVEVTEEDKDKHVAKIIGLMTLKGVEWIKGLKLTADAYTTKYYMKD